jgi:hypothetical protein
MYKDLDKRSECAREKQRLYRLRKKGVTPDALPPVTPDEIVTPEFVKGMSNWAKKRGKVTVVIPGAIKTVSDVPKLPPRSIGMGIDTRLEMQRKFVGK